MKIAITGTIGSGKSEMSNYLRNKYGFFVFDSDKTNSEILKDNPKLLYKDFSECFVDGTLDKRKLADIVFNDVTKRKKLESIMHPLILDKMLSNYNLKPNELFFAEVPLLFESGWDKYFDLIVLVTCDEDNALQRLLKRGLSIKESKNRIKNQMSTDDKLARSDVIIYNNSSLSSFYEKIDEWLKNVR